MRIHSCALAPARSSHKGAAGKYMCSKDSSSPPQADHCQCPWLQLRMHTSSRPTAVEQAPRCRDRCHPLSSPGKLHPAVQAETLMSSYRTKTRAQPSRHATLRVAAESGTCAWPSVARPITSETILKTSKLLHAWKPTHRYVPRQVAIILRDVAGLLHARLCLHGIHTAAHIDYAHLLRG